MALVHSPSIVTSGLVLCLDAANRKSYPGSGDIWTDLSGNGNTGTLTNGPTYSDANGGVIVFDGSNDCIVVNNNANILSKTAYTKIAWFYPTSFATANNLVSGGNSGEHAFWLGASTQLRAGHNGAWNEVVSNTTLSLNNWYCGAVTYSNTSGWVLYLNGILEDTAAITTTFNGNQEILIGAYITGSNVFTGRIPQALVYNRVLTATEIAQNYNALKGRYGLT